MTLVFPDQVPSRFGVALRTATTKQLERRIAEHESGAADGTATGDREISGSQVLLELVKALSHHDRLTRGHCERVRAYTDMIADQMAMSDEDTNRLRWAALVHDVGKLRVPGEILTKNGPLTDEEYEIVKTHAAEGQRICAPLAPWLGPWVNAVGQHHERWDGKGYPNGLVADDIHIGARIVAVADTYDVITAARSYKKPLSPALARNEITRCAGTQFDPAVVRAFLSISLGQLRFQTGPIAWLTALPFLPTVAVARIALAGTLGLATTGAGVVATGIENPGENPEELALTDDRPPSEEVRSEESPSGNEPGGTTTTDPTATTTGDSTEPSVTTDGTSPTESGTDNETSTTTDPSEQSPTTVDRLITLPGLPTSQGQPVITSSTAPGTNPTTTSAGGTTTSTTATSTTSTTAQPNRAPEAATDLVSTSEDQVLDITGASLLANDSDPDLDVLSVISVTSFHGGYPTLTGGVIRFTPDPDHYGTGAFLYTISDGVETDTASVQVTIGPMPDDPIAVDDAFATAPGLPLVVAAPGLLGNDDDPDGEPVSVTLNPLNQPANGVVTVNTDGSFLYIPNLLFSGADSFTYDIQDPGGRTDTATVTIDVS